MTGYELWTDSEHNRLHLIIRRGLSRPEVATAHQRVRAAVQRLRPGFSITVQQELEPPAADAAGRLSAPRLQRDVARILRAADPDLLVA